MRALVCTQSGNASFEDMAADVGLEIGDLTPFLREVSDADRPKPSSGQVLVKVGLATVNPSDLHFIKGEYGQPRREGIAAGFEGMGDVVESGGGLYANFLKGKRVAFASGPDGTGAWAEFALVDAMSCIPVKADIRDEDAANFIVNPLTAVAMYQLLKPTRSKSFVMSAGASSLCKLILGLARDDGTKPIAMVRRAEQADELTALGAAHVLDLTTDDFAERLAEIARKEKTRLFLDAVSDEISTTVFDALGSHARWIVYGHLGQNTPTISNPGTLIFQQKRIEGFWLMPWMKNASTLSKMSAVRTVQNRFATGKWETDIATTLPLSQAMDKLPEALAQAHGRKVLIRP